MESFSSFCDISMIDDVGGNDDERTDSRPFIAIAQSANEEVINEPNNDIIDADMEIDEAMPMAYPVVPAVAPPLAWAVAAKRLAAEKEATPTRASLRVTGCTAPRLPVVGGRRYAALLLAANRTAPATVAIT